MSESNDFFMTVFAFRLVGLVNSESDLLIDLSQGFGINFLRARKKQSLMIAISSQISDQ